MKFRLDNFSDRRGFTLVEILMTVVIIGILVGLLIPALSIVRKTATIVKQKSQFSSIEMGIEAFKVDFGVYPQSQSIGGNTYQGAQKLAEAMVGLDGLGFHPDSVWRADGYDNSVPTPLPLYRKAIEDTYAAGAVRDAAWAASLAARQDRYLEIETAKITKLSDIYSDVTMFAVDTIVLADTFGKVRHRSTGKRTGMPILYYRANTSGTTYSNMYPLSLTFPPSSTLYNNNYIFVRTDAAGAGIPFPTNEPGHPAGFDQNKFYNLIKNQDLPGSDLPYRADSFILHSAGPDGLYGTADDVFNFSRSE